MRCALASLGFINGNVMFNRKVMINTMIKYSNDVDIVIFGEAFLQGFYGATFDVEHDDKLAITQDNPIIKDICSAAREYAVAVSLALSKKRKTSFIVLRSQSTPPER